MAKTTFDEISVFGFKDVQAGVEHHPPRYDDHVETWRDLVTTKNLSYQSFSPVSQNGATQLSGGGNTQPTQGPAVGQQEHRAVAPLDLGAMFVNLLEIRAATNMLGGQESHT
jgi:hypothetical protein